MSDSNQKFFNPSLNLIFIGIISFFTIISGTLGATCVCIEENHDQYIAISVMTGLAALFLIVMILAYVFKKPFMKFEKWPWYIFYFLAILFGIVISSMALACAVPCEKDSKRKTTEGIASFTLTASIIFGAIGLFLTLKRPVDLSGGFGPSITLWTNIKSDVAQLTGYPVP